jgi:creatinine amidohydrolase/Fe(II)-dependent formamide hydrolase-like protein
VRAHALTEYYRITETQYRQALKSRGFTDAEIGTHAGVADTSLALAIDPRLVRAAQLASASSLDAAHGVYGDPRRASAEAGAAGVDLIVRESVAAIRRSVAR